MDPTTKVGQLIRTYSRLSGALGDYADEGTGPFWTEDGRRKRRPPGDPRGERRLAVVAMLKALREFPDDLEEAIAKFSGFCESIKTRRLAEEVEAVIPTLVRAYHDPGRFFNRIAPRIDPEAFGAHADDARRLEALQSWGCAALLNGHIRQAFLRADPIIQNISLDRAEGRRLRGRVGRPPRRTQQIRAVFERDPAADLDELAKKWGIKLSSLERTIKRDKTPDVRALSKDNPRRNVKTLRDGTPK